jgi:hypothetical protein
VLSSKEKRPPKGPPMFASLFRWASSFGTISTFTRWHGDHLLMLLLKDRLAYLVG